MKKPNIGKMANFPESLYSVGFQTTKEATFPGGVEGLKPSDAIRIARLWRAGSLRLCCKHDSYCKK
ncbi:MAG: hypothetical protein LLF96_05690 [Eubacteriales bacterium]|nr:hypothetical protein [Eubacteriales bacterium]